MGVNANETLDASMKRSQVEPDAVVAPSGQAHGATRPARFVSLRWKVLWVVSVTVLCAIAALLVLQYLDSQARQRHALAEATERYKQALITMLDQAHERAEYLGSLIPDLADVREALDGGRLQAARRAADQYAFALDLHMGIEALTITTLGELKAPAAHTRSTSERRDLAPTLPPLWPAASLSDATAVASMGQPVSRLSCMPPEPDHGTAEPSCRLITWLPVSGPPGTNPVIGLATNATDLLIDFHRATGAHLALLPHGATAPFRAHTFPSLAPSVQQRPRDALHRGDDTGIYRVIRLVLPPGDGPVATTPVFVVASDVSALRAEAWRSQRNLAIATLATLALAQGIMMFLLRGPLWRMRLAAHWLPSLAEHEHRARARQALSRVSARDRLADESDLIAVVAGDLASRIERAETHMAASIRARSEAELRAAAEERARRDLVAQMSHEFRTPLNAIQGYAQLIAGPGTAETAASETGRSEALTPAEAIAGIQRAGRHLSTMIDNLLTLAYAEAGELTLNVEPTRIDTLVADAVALVRPKADSKGVHLHVTELGDAVPTLALDAGRLRQVLVNLLDNAIKFSDQGRVWLDIEISAAALELRVTDSGRGIAPSERDHVFQAFAQAPLGRARGGSGLGLAISRTLVEAMDGTLTLADSSARGPGACFVVHLPLAAAATLARQDSKLALGASVYTATVLQPDLPVPGDEARTKVWLAQAPAALQARLNQACRLGERERIRALLAEHPAPDDPAAAHARYLVDRFCFAPLAQWTETPASNAPSEPPETVHGPTQDPGHR